MSNPIIIVTGTDTDIGKTVFCAGLVGLLGATYWKPVQSGLEDETDSEKVARLSGVVPERILPETYRLDEPASPHYAAALEGVTIDPAQLPLPACEGPLVVEGAGGALVPINDTLLYADLFAQWGQPTVIVTSTQLGTINHSLLTIEALRRRSVPILGVAFTGEAVDHAQQAICDFGAVRSLGRLPQLATLDQPALSKAFASAFKPEDFLS